jgi:hypothetical protein
MQDPAAELKLGYRESHVRRRADLHVIAYLTYPDRRPLVAFLERVRDALDPVYTSLFRV